jgi:hypothetical protein
MALALIPAFGLTAGVTQACKAEQRRLAAEWFTHRNQALENDRPAEAITAFRTALTFSRVAMASAETLQLFVDEGKGDLAAGSVRPDDASAGGASRPLSRYGTAASWRCPPSAGGAPRQSPPAGGRDYGRRHPRALSEQP